MLRYPIEAQSRFRAEFDIHYVPSRPTIYAVHGDWICRWPTSIRKASVQASHVVNKMWKVLRLRLSKVKENLITFSSLRPDQGLPDRGWLPTDPVFMNCINRMPWWSIRCRILPENGVELQWNTKAPLAKMQFYSVFLLIAKFFPQ